MNWKKSYAAMFLLTIYFGALLNAQAVSPDIIWLPHGISIHADPYRYPSVFSPYIDEFDLIQVHDEQDLIGFISVTGNLVIPPQYRHAGAFFDGLAWVSLEIDGQEKYGVIDQQGKEVVPFEYEYLDNFYEDRALAGMKPES